MKEYKFLTEWDNVEDITKKIMAVFSPWEKRNLAIVHGKREQTTEDTYGLPYTSSSEFAMLGNTNVDAVLRKNAIWHFDWLALTDEGIVVAGFENHDNEEAQIVIGEIEL